MIDQPAATSTLPLRKWTVLALIGIIFLWAAVGLSPYFLIKDQPGQFGDVFGAVNALFSGLAFAGVILTILLQAEELKLQRRELADTRTELVGQKQQMEIQAQALSRQAADANFFFFLDMYRSTARNIQHPGVSRAGIGYWDHVVDRWRARPNVSGSATPELIRKEWPIFYAQWQASLGPYFATLAQLLEIIEAASGPARISWSRMLRAQIAPDEMVLIFYHAASVEGLSRLRRQIEEFHLFRYFPGGGAYDFDRVLRHWYNSSAFDDGEGGP